MFSRSTGSEAKTLGQPTTDDGDFLAIENSDGTVTVTLGQNWTVEMVAGGNRSVVSIQLSPL